MRMLALTSVRLYVGSITIAIGLTARPVLGVTEELSMDVLPEEAGWQRLGGGSATVDGGFLTMDVPKACFCHQEYRSPNSWFETVNNAWGWEVAFRMRVESSASNFPYVNVCLHIDDRRRSIVVGLDEDRVFLEAGIVIASFLVDTTDSFHTYRIVGHHDALDVFVDDVHAMSVTNTNPVIVPTGIVDFGDCSAGSNPSMTTWDFFRYETYGPISRQGQSWATTKSLYR